MAEVLGTVASGAGIFALAVQLGDSIKKLNEFWTNYKDCPEDVRETTNELEILKLVIEDISENHGSQQNLTVRIGSVVGKAIQHCEAAAKKLKILVDEFERLSLVGKKVAALRTAFKKGEWDKLRCRLEGAKLSLMLAHECYYRAIQYRQLSSHGRLLEQMNVTLQANIVRNQSSQNGSDPFQSSTADRIDGSESQIIRNQGVSHSEVQVERDQLSGCSEKHTMLIKHGTLGVNNSPLTKGLLGSVWYQNTSTKRTIRNKSSDRKRTSTEEELRVILRLPTWFFSRQYDIRVRKSQRGWDHTLRSYNIVPENAPVFRYCIEGDVDALRVLFESGYASPHDADPDGITLLHYAAVSLRPNVCNLLLDYDADVHHFSNCSIFNPRKMEHIKNRLITDSISLLNGTPLSYILRLGSYVTRLGFRPEFESTVRVLIEKGQYDLSTLSFTGSIRSAIYMGPTDLYRWIKSQSIMPLVDLDHNFERSLEIIITHSQCGWDNTPELLREMLPNGLPDSRVSSYQTQDGKTLLSVLTTAWLPYISKQRTRYASFESLIKDLVISGADLHVITQGNRLYRSLFLQSWLLLLEECQVSLLSFWEEEIKFRDSGQVSWLLSWEVPESIDFQILRIIYGERAQDFDIVIEDVYVTNDILPSFWELVEGEAHEDDWEGPKVPGSWVHD